MAGIIDSICRGEWISFGIETWNDLLKSIFKKINHNYNIYVGAEGLKRARKELEKFKKENKRIPKAKDKGMDSISSACYKGRWLSFGITFWNDLLIYVFGNGNRKRK